MYSNNQRSFYLYLYLKTIIRLLKKPKFCKFEDFQIFLPFSSQQSHQDWNMQVALKTLRFLKHKQKIVIIFIIVAMPWEFSITPLTSFAGKRNFSIFHLSLSPTCRFDFFPQKCDKVYMKSTCCKQFCFSNENRRRKFFLQANYEAQKINESPRKWSEISRWKINYSIFLTLN